MPVPNSFANVTTSIPLSQLDANFNTPITIGNTAVQLGNTVTTLNNMTLANVTISSGSVTITNVSATTANVTTANVTNLISGNVALTGGSINGTTLGASNAATANVTTLTATNLTLSNSAVISVNTAGDALRITQTGAGNALVVEDSANPDSTPFVIDSSGIAIQGNTSTLSFSAPAGTVTPTIQSIAQASSLTQGIASVTNVTSANGPNFIFGKSRGASASSPTIVSDADVTGTISFTGYDGTAYLRTAQISSNVDGTPGTNDMPGRLVFFTTADGASSPTERMRIDSAGRVSVGSSGTIAGQSFRVTLPITGSTTSYGIVSAATVQSDVTVAGMGYRSNLSTAAASFTVTDLIGYIAEQATIGAGSTVTNQYGFLAQNNLTGATNNYGFYSNIASGTGRWNFYAGGTADNAFNGNSRFGGLTAPTVAVDVTGAILATTNIRSSGATSGIGYATGAGGTATQGAGSGKATAVTLNNVCGQITMNNATLNAGTTVTFTLTNSAIAATDVLVLNHVSGGTAGSYLLNAQAGAGSASINVRNITAGNLGEAIVIGFAVIEAVTA